MTNLPHGHTHQKPATEPITRYQDDPRWQELDAEYAELRRGNPQENFNRITEVIWQQRDIARAYEQLDARKALISRILFDHPAGASLSSTDAEELAQAIALKLI